MESLRRRIANANALLVFESAARLSSFTRAAEELGISQPAVTRHIKTLEADIGRPLFRRDHNRLSLNPDGERLWASVGEGFRDMAATLDGLREGGARQRLLVASHSGFAQQWLMPRFSELCAELADFDVQLMISDLETDLDRGGYDLAIRIGDAAARARRGGRLLIAETVFPVASPGFLERHPAYRGADPAALLDAPLLHMDEGAQPWLTWRGWFRAQGVAARPRRPEVLYSNYPLVLQEALAGRGVALAWRPLTDLAVRQGTLIPVGPAVENAGTGYYLTWPENSPAAPFGPALCRWFDARIAAADAG